MKPDCRILAIMGSGETSPTMVTVHKALVGELGVTRPDAVLLDTPYAFQENAADISARAVAYFASSVGLDVGRPLGRSQDAARPGRQVSRLPPECAPLTGCSPARGVRPMRWPGGARARSAWRCASGSRPGAA